MLMPERAGNNFCAAVELHHDGPENEAAEGQANQRERIAIVKNVGEKRGKCAGYKGPGEVALQAVSRCLAPGEERANASKEKNGKADGNHDLVEEGRANADARGREPLRKDRESVPERTGDAGHQEKQIIEQEAGLAGDHGVELILALQVVVIFDIGDETHHQRQQHEADKPGARSGSWRRRARNSRRRSA